MKTSSAFCKVSIVLLISSCTWDKTPLLVTDGICFEKEIFPIINSNCAKSGCHDAITAEDGYDLSGYFGIMAIVEPGKPNESKLIEVIKGGEEIMPPEPNPPLTYEQISLIEQWILEGAGINPGCEADVPCDTSNVTYKVTIASIISANCLGCHSSSGTGGGILLTTYAQVKDQVNNGKFWGTVNHESGYVPMPQNAAQLSDCDLAKIRIWIDQGAPNS